jgi:hypothetical protein
MNIRRRLADEQGVALVLAVLIIAIITIAASSAIFFTTGSQSHGYRTKSGFTAYSLAQAALSAATEQLTTHYYDSSGQPHDNTTTLTQMASWAANGSQRSPSSSSSCTTSPVSSCMTWSSILECPSGITCSAGAPSVVVTGVEKAIWHVTGVGVVPNPTGSGSISRSITIDVPVNAPPGKTGIVGTIYDSIYSGGTGNPCDMNMSQGVSFVAPVYVVGNLCINNPQAGVFYPGTLHVGGYLYIKNGAVGTAANPVTDLEVRGACNGTQQMTPTCVSTLFKPAPPPTVNYWTDGSNGIYVNPDASGNPSFPDQPTEDFASRAIEGSPYTCTGVETLGTNPFDPGPLTGDYSCTAPSGSITWNHSTQTLTIAGNVYIYGALTTPSNEKINFSGIGGIFVDGAVTFGNNTAICVNGWSGNHDCNGGSNWDTSKNFLMIFGRGSITGANLGLQGGLYSQQNIDFGSGQTDIYGPLIGSQLLIPGQQAATTFPVITQLITTWPNTPQPYWTLGAPVNGTY